MTGNEHYEEADRLLTCIDEEVQSPYQIALRTELAKAHAALAIAAYLKEYLPGQMT